jgi:hypothetical protein
MNTILTGINNVLVPISSANNIYVSPSSPPTTSLIEKFVVTCVDANQQTLSIYKVAPSGSANNNTNQIIPPQAIQPNSVTEIGELEGQTLPAGYMLQAVVSGNNNTSFVNGTVTQFS